MKPDIFQDNIDYIFSNNVHYLDKLNHAASRCHIISNETNKSYFPKDIYFDNSLYIADLSTSVLDALASQAASPDSVSIPRVAQSSSEKKTCFPLSDCIGKTNEQLAEGVLSFESFSKYDDNDSICRIRPCLLILGILNLIHIDQFIKEHGDIRSIIIVEDRIESLYILLSVISLRAIKSKLLEQGITLTLIIDVDSNAVKLQQRFVDHIVSNNLLAAHSLQIIKSPCISSELRSFHTWLHSPEGYGISVFSALGFTTDEVNQSINSLLNASSHKTITSCELFTEQKFASTACILVASGPSLQEHINYLKSVPKDSFIIACGSSLGVLLKENIIPSAFLLLERNPDVYDDLAILKSEGFDFSNIPLISALGVDYRIPPLFKRNTAFIRPAAIYAELFPNYAKSVLPISGPQVINAACEFVFMHGCRSILLIGADLASSQGSVRCNSAFGVSERVFDIPIRGLNGKTVFSSVDLLHSRTRLESFLSNLPDIRVYRPKNGIPIKHTTTLDSINEFDDVLINAQGNHNPLEVTDKSMRFSESTHILSILREAPSVSELKVNQLCELLQKKGTSFNDISNTKILNTLLSRLQKHDSPVEYFIGHFFSRLVFFTLQPLVFKSTNSNSYSLPNAVWDEMCTNLENINVLFKLYCNILTFIECNKNILSDFDMSTLTRLIYLIESGRFQYDNFNSHGKHN